MGERIWASVTVLAKDQEQFESIAAEAGWDGFEQGPMPQPDGTVYYDDCQVNYGSFGFEEDLQAAGIAYDKAYDSGPDWSKGCEYFRPGHPLIDISEQAELVCQRVVDDLEKHGGAPELVAKYRAELPACSLKSLIEEEA